jgi:hypothetical protein
VPEGNAHTRSTRCHHTQLQEVPNTWTKLAWDLNPHTPYYYTTLHFLLQLICYTLQRLHWFQIWPCETWSAAGGVMSSSECVATCKLVLTPTRTCSLQEEVSDFLSRRLRPQACQVTTSLLASTLIVSKTVNITSRWTCTC